MRIRVNAWHEIILSERVKRIDGYRAKMIGPDSLWKSGAPDFPKASKFKCLRRGA